MGWSIKKGTLVLAAGALTLGSLASASVAQAASSSHPRLAGARLSAINADGTTRSGKVRHACSAPSRPGRMTCLALERTGTPQEARAALHPDTAPTGVGYGPSDLRSAYHLPSATAGAGQTVAVVDAYNDPNAASDLAVYRAAWGLPACTAASGCFQQVNQEGQASPLPAAAGTTGWGEEESLDVDMVSAICPNCHILLVEANSDDITDLGAAVDAAVALGAKYISNSYGGPEYAGETSDDVYYDHPGVAITAGAGDSWYGVSYPAASPYVTSVGGTTLSKWYGTWIQAVWNDQGGTGSGCSAYEPKPAWQADAGCSNRTDNDVAADASPYTGVAVYDTYDPPSDGGLWNAFGGTSVATPIIASIYALAGTPAAGSNPASYPYFDTSGLKHVSSGTDDGTGTCSPNYLCTAGPGYNGPTGWGTPDGTAAFTSPAGDKVVFPDPGDQAVTVGSAVSLQVHAFDSATGAALTYAATGLPAGLSIDPATGLISGTPAVVGTAAVTVTATDPSGESASSEFTWTISATTCPPSQLLANPGFETGKFAPSWLVTRNVSKYDLLDWGPGDDSQSGLWWAGWSGILGETTTPPVSGMLSQTVTIPATCQHASLSFYLQILDEDEDYTKVYQTFDVKVATSSGKVTTLAKFTNADGAKPGAGVYVQHSLSLNAFIGQTITLRFIGTDDASFASGNSNTLFWEDQNALDVS
jgi:Putative Ig domain